MALEPNKEASISQKQHSFATSANAHPTQLALCCHQTLNTSTTHKRLIPQSGLAYTHTPIHARIPLPCPPNSILYQRSLRKLADLRSLISPSAPAPTPTPTVTNNHAVPNLRLSPWLHYHGILPERSHCPACLCDDAHLTTRPTFDVRLTRHTIVSRRKVEPS